MTDLAFPFSLVYSGVSHRQLTGNISLNLKAQGEIYTNIGLIPRVRNYFCAYALRPKHSTMNILLTGVKMANSM